jgi:hypothetical protein
MISGGVSLPLPAFTADIVAVPPGFNGQTSIDAVSYLSSQGQSPAYVAFIIGLGSQDAVTKLLMSGLSTGFPMPLNRLQNLGNLSGVASAQAIVNDGNAVTPWLETTPTGSPGSTWSADTAGNMTAKELNAGVLTTLFQLIVGTGVKLGATTRTTEVLGNLLADANIIMNNNTQFQIKDHLGNIRNVLTTDPQDDINIFGLSGRDLIQIFKSDTSLKFVFDLINGLINISGVKQTITGNTSGTMDIYEIFAGALKIVVFVQTNYRDTNAFANVTLKTAFSTVGCILNFGCGGIFTGTAGVQDTDNRQITWGTGVTAGTQSAATGIPQNAAGFTTHGFTQVGSNNYGSVHSGVGFFIGV